jgi:hypothetical protein
MDAVAAGVADGDMQAVDRVRLRFPVHVEHGDVLGTAAEPEVLGVDELSIPPPGVGTLVHARRDPLHRVVERRQQPCGRLEVDQANAADRLHAWAERPERLVDVELRGQRGEPVAVAPVDSLLRRPERGEWLAARMHVVELRAHHRPEDTAPPVRGQDADDGHAGGGQPCAAGHGHPETERARPADDRAVLLEGGEHPLELEDRQPAFEPVVVRLVPPEVVDDHADRVAQLVGAGASADLHLDIRRSSPTGRTRASGGARPRRRRTER